MKEYPLFWRLYWENSIKSPIKISKGNLAITRLLGKFFRFAWLFFFQSLCLSPLERENYGPTFCRFLARRFLDFLARHFLDFLAQHFKDFLAPTFCTNSGPTVSRLARVISVSTISKNYWPISNYRSVFTSACFWLSNYGSVFASACFD